MARSQAKGLIKLIEQVHIVLLGLHVDSGHDDSFVVISGINIVCLQVLTPARSIDSRVRGRPDI